MIARLLYTKDTNPHRNLAREEALLNTFEGSRRDEALLFLWQNANTVVIGRNQNAWRECRTALLTQEGGTLARRTTGGGAVFHDLGNLNFSFILPRGAYDLSRQLSVVREAVRAFGIDCEFSGRNDLIADGRKFSGNAFRFTRDGALHHGTLMVAVDPEKMARYLSVSPEKLAVKGVKSVPSRVVNLSALSDVTITTLTEAMQDAFRKEYGPCAVIHEPDMLALPTYEALCQRNVTWEWNYGATPAFDAVLEKRFDWGGIELCLTLEAGHIKAAKVYTDAMDVHVAESMETALAGCPFDREVMQARIGGDVGAWLGTLSL